MDWSQRSHFLLQPPPPTRTPPLAAAAGSTVQTLPQIAGQTVAVAAPAIDNAVAPTFGVVGFTAQPAAAAAPKPLTITKIAQPAPAAAPAAAADTTRASRTTTRTAAPRSTPLRRRPAGSSASRRACPASTTATAARRPAGFDCSGFTSYVYRQVGKSIPRTAEAQRAASSKVSNPVPGDLIFFGYPAYHVGIYAGGNMMYDSPRTGKTTGLHVIWTQSNVSYGRF